MRLMMLKMKHRHRKHSDTSRSGQQQRQRHPTATSLAEGNPTHVFLSGLSGTFNDMTEVRWT